MIRGMTGTILWVCLAGAVGVGLFFVKHKVSDLETRLAGVNRDIQANQEEMHVLRAEWSYLNDPARLRELAEKHLGMHTVAPVQIATLDSLPTGDVPAVAAAAPSHPSRHGQPEVAAARHAPARNRNVALAAPPLLDATDFVSGREEAR